MCELIIVAHCSIFDKTRTAYLITYEAFFVLSDRSDGITYANRVWSPEPALMRTIGCGTEFVGVKPLLPVIMNHSLIVDLSLLAPNAYAGKATTGQSSMNRAR